MEIRNARRWAEPGAKRYVGALMVVFAAFLLRSLMHPVLDHSMPGVFFACAVIIVEFVWGLGPALMAMVISIPIFDFFFVPPFRDIAMVDRRDVMIVTGFLSITPLAVVLIERLRRAQYRAELIAEVAQTRYEMLLRAENERMVLSDSVQLGNALMTYLTKHLDTIFYLANPVTHYEFVDEHFRRATGVTPEVVKRDGLRALLHPEDAARLAGLFSVDGERPQHGAHNLRMRTREGGYEMFHCELQYFRAHVGTYAILRLHAGPAVRPVTSLHALTPAANAREVSEAPVVSGGV
jgi:PAS domain-containing protein